MPGITSASRGLEVKFLLRFNEAPAECRGSQNVPAMKTSLILPLQ